MTCAPIVITGCPRSGTTWAGTTLGYSPEVFYLYEPFNDEAPHHLDVPARYVYVEPGDSPPFAAAVDDLVALGSLTHRVRLAARGGLHLPSVRRDVPALLSLRKLRDDREGFRRAQRACIKDPLAFFASEWLAERYGARVVVLVRHPAGMISSYLKLGWKTEVDSLLLQPQLVDRFLGPLEADIARFRASPDDTLLGLILQWKLFAQAALSLARSHSDWLFVSHEALCETPLAGFRRIYDFCGLSWTTEIEARVVADTMAENTVDPTRHQQHVLQRDSKAVAKAWRNRLDADALQRIERETAELQAALAEITDQGPATACGQVAAVVPQRASQHTSDTRV